MSPQDSLHAGSDVNEKDLNVPTLEERQAKSR
jgi:hypothetical protein